MAKIRKSISIRAPLEDVYEFMTRPENLPEIWPGLFEVSHVRRGPDGAHSYDWVHKMGGVLFKGHAETLDVTPKQRVVIKNEKGITSTTLWAFSSDNGCTKVGLDVDYVPPEKLLEKFPEPFLHRINEREAEMLLENLKNRLEISMRTASTRPVAQSLAR